MIGISVRVIVLAVIVDQGRVLIVKRARPSDDVPSDDVPTLTWAFPGGQVKTGEALEDALHREIGEETGLTVHVTDLIHARLLPDTDILTLYYGCRLLSAEPTLTLHNRVEIADWRWVSGQEALGHFTGDVAAPVVRWLLSL